LDGSPEKGLANRKGKPRVMGRPNPPLHNKELAPQPPTSQKEGYKNCEVEVGESTLKFKFPSSHLPLAHFLWVKGR